MEKNSVFGLGIFLVILIFTCGIIYNIFFVEKEIPQDVDVKTLTVEDFDFQYTYIGENTWRYTLRGELPNSCYTISTEAIVMESYPEKVQVKSTIKYPTEDMVCTQSIQEIDEEGEFEASEYAQISFEIE